MTPPAARAAVSRRRRATTRRRSKALVAQGPRIARCPLTGGATTTPGRTPAASRRGRSERRKIRRHVPPGSDRQPGSGERLLDECACPPFDRTAARQEQPHDPRATRGRWPGERARAATGREAATPRLRRSIRRRPRTRRDDPGRPARQAQAAGPGRATARPRPRRTRRRTHRARTAPRTAARRGGGPSAVTLVVAWCGSMACLSEDGTARPPSTVRQRPVRGWREWMSRRRAPVGVRRPSRHT